MQVIVVSGALCVPLNLQHQLNTKGTHSVLYLIAKAYVKRFFTDRYYTYAAP